MSLSLSLSLNLSLNLSLRCFSPGLAPGWSSERVGSPGAAGLPGAPGRAGTVQDLHSALTSPLGEQPPHIAISTGL